jgi:hypothetical protein
MHGSRSKIPSKKSRPYIYYVKFVALLGAPYIYSISRLRVNGSYFYDLSVVIISLGPNCFSRLHNSHLGQGINLK